MKITKRDVENQKGIALVMVLGFLSVLTIMAVGFAISMRTERLATAAYIDMVKAKQLARLAVSRAMDDVDYLMTGGVIGGHGSGQDIINFSVYYPPPINRSVRLFSSVGYDDPDNPPAFMDNNLIEYLPDAFYKYGTDQSNDMVSIINDESGWNNIVDADDQLIGRYSYLVMNSSGFLDANIVGGSNRFDGAHPAELQIEYALNQDYGTPIDMTKTKFLEARDELVHYESIFDLDVSARDYANSVNKDLSWRFTPYSYYPPKVGLDLSTTNVYALTNLNTASKEEIVGVFAECDIPTYNGNYDMLYSNLIDYTDNDLIPENLYSFSTEPVPMINEVVAASRFTRTPTGNTNEYEFNHTLTVSIEYWYPFSSGPSAIFTPEAPTVVRPLFDFDVEVPPLPPPLLFLGPLYSELDPASAPLSSPTPASFGAIPGTEWYQVDYVYSMDSSPIIIPGGVSIPFDMDVAIEGVQLFNGADVVDMASNMPSIKIESGNINNETLVEEMKGVSCVDPRYNWTNVVNGTTTWDTEPSTLGDVNNNTTTYIGSDPECDDAGEFHVANAAIDNVAELGFLAYGEPWKSIRLYNIPYNITNYHPVLNYFTTSNEQNQATRGLVFMNSEFNANRTLIYGLIPRTSPEDGSGAAIATGDAEALKDGLIFDGAAQRYDIAKMMNEWITTYVDGGAGSPFTTTQYEMFIHDTHRLISWRNGTFNVVAIAQAVNAETNILAEQRCAVTFWRDPVREEWIPNGVAVNQEPTRIHFFKWFE